MLTNTSKCVHSCFYGHSGEREEFIAQLEIISHLIFISPCFPKHVVHSIFISLNQIYSPNTCIFVLISLFKWMEIIRSSIQFTFFTVLFLFFASQQVSTTMLTLKTTNSFLPLFRFVYILSFFLEVRWENPQFAEFRARKLRHKNRLGRTRVEIALRPDVLQSETFRAEESL